MTRDQIAQHNMIAARAAIPKLFALRHRDPEARSECRAWVRILRAAEGR